MAREVVDTGWRRGKERLYRLGLEGRVFRLEASCVGLRAVQGLCCKCVNRNPEWTFCFSSLEHEYMKTVLDCVLGIGFR